MRIGEINISLGMSFVGAHTCEEMMQEASREEAKGPKVFKTNSLCVMAGATEGCPLETVKEKESGQKPSFVQKEKKEEEAHTVVSQRNIQEEHSGSILTQWEKELKMLEDWLNHPKIEEDYQRDAIMKNSKGNLQEGKSPEEIKKKEKQPVDNNNNLQQNNCQESKRELQQKSQPGDRMDKEIMELRGLVERSSKETREDYGGKLNKSLQHMIWRPGENPATTGEETTTTTTERKRSKWTTLSQNLGPWRISTTTIEP
jgi:hypothetical protein